MNNSINLPLNVEQVRKDFPILSQTMNDSPLLYLDSAATTQKPQSVIDRLVQYYSTENANVHRGIYPLSEHATECYEAARDRVARFINAPSSRNVVFTRGTTESINLVASAWGDKFVSEGDEIIISEMEHHSNMIPWQLLAQRTGAILKYIPVTRDGMLDFEALATIMTPRTRMIAITHMSNVFGTVNPVRRLIRYAHDRGIPVLLDGAQSVPHLPVDVQNLGCDFLAFSGHKMLGPTGIGALYAADGLLENMLPYQGGGEMISSVWFDKATWNEIPHKYEAGTPNIAGAIGMAAAVDYLENLGMDRITHWEQKLTTIALKRMREVEDLEIYGEAPERGGVISFHLGPIHPHDLAVWLGSRGIAIRAGHHCAQPIRRKLDIPATARASFYLYNTIDEIDRFVEALQNAREFFHFLFKR